MPSLVGSEMCIRDRSETFDSANQFFLEILRGPPEGELVFTFFCIMNEWIAGPTEYFGFDSVSTVLLNRRHHVHCLHSANLPRPSLGNHHRCRPSNGEFDLGASSSHEALVLYCTALGTSVRTSKSIVWGPCKKQDATNYSGGSRRLLMRHRLRWEDRTTNGTGFYLGSFFLRACLE